MNNTNANNNANNTANTILIILLVIVVGVIVWYAAIRHHGVTSPAVQLNVGSGSSGTSSTGM